MFPHDTLRGLVVIVGPFFLTNIVMRYLDVPRSSAKAPSSSLGSLTVALLLPPQRQLKFVNLDVFNDCVNLGSQLSRCCPFDCEFCDIIELFGRMPRPVPLKPFMLELNRFNEQVDRAHTHGMTISAGFIFGFPEKQRTDNGIINLAALFGMKRASCCLSIAPPEIQILRRLNHGGLLPFVDITPHTDTDASDRSESSEKQGEEEENPVVGRNLVKTRDTEGVFHKCQIVLARIFSPQTFTPAPVTSRRVKVFNRHKPAPWEQNRETRSMLPTG